MLSISRFMLYNSVILTRAKSILRLGPETRAKVRTRDILGLGPEARARVITRGTLGLGSEPRGFLC